MIASLRKCWFSLVDQDLLSTNEWKQFSETYFWNVSSHCWLENIISRVVEKNGVRECWPTLYSKHLILIRALIVTYHKCVQNRWWTFRRVTSWLNILLLSLALSLSLSLIKCCVYKLSLYRQTVYKYERWARFILIWRSGPGCAVIACMYV